MSTTTTMTTTAQTANLAPATAKQTNQEFLASLGDKHVEPLWGVLNKMVPPAPNPKADVASWPYASMRPSLIQSGSVVSAEEAERRVLMLVNPSLSAPCTTDTIYAGLQLILPGETAPAHRHVAFALRFIIEGSHGFTAVEGEKIMMERGDVILTPSWHWHDHGHEGTGPMIWLDGLDLPVYKFLPVNFAENYAESRYPSVPAENSKLRFPWAPVGEKLDESTEFHAVYHYGFEDGSHLSKTISAQAERVSSGATSPVSQETCSFVYHVYEGEGYTTLLLPDGKTERRVDWTKSDSFSVPAWCKVSHTCTQSSGNAYLFAINDRPMIDSLGLARKA